MRNFFNIRQPSAEATILLPARVASGLETQVVEAVFETTGDRSHQFSARLLRNG
ncbi:MAG: hypothetical protein ACYDBH_06775 [Acidobacteriaceae bacterium]